VSSFLPNTTTTDKYADVQLGGQSTPYDRGQLLIANNPASLIIFRGRDRSSITPDEYQYVTPSLIPLVRGDKEFIFGVQIKSAIVGTPAQVSGFLVEPGVAGLGAGSAYTGQVAAGGGVTPGLSAVRITHGGVLVGTEPTLDFEDSGGAMLFNVADDPANTRVTVSVPRLMSLNVSAAGAIISQSGGFTVVNRLGVGRYSIGWTAFPLVPAVTASVTSASTGNEDLTLSGLTVSGVQVNVNDASVQADRPFSLLLIPTTS
jgi:hypothetical protein